MNVKKWMKKYPQSAADSMAAQAKRDGKTFEQLASECSKKSTTIFPKFSVRKNAWDNWYGYCGSKKVQQFFGGPTGSQEEHAKEWLAKENAARDAKLNELADALNDTWQTIAYDVRDCGGDLTPLGCAEVAADHVYAYGDNGRMTERSKQLSKEIFALSNADFRRVAKYANLGF